MAEHPNTLTLSHEVHTRTWRDGRFVRRPQSHFLDVVVDGVPLRGRVADAADLVTELNRPWLHAVEEAVDVLLGRRPHPALGAGRVAVLVCGECGDLDCGALTAALDVDSTTVSWSDWRWTDSTGEAEAPAEAAIPAFVFARDAYTATLLDAPARLAPLPYDELEHHGRGFLWPWQWGWRLPER